MRLRITDRILVCLAGLLLIACCAGIIAQMFFGVDLVGIAGRVFSSNSVQVKAALITISAFLLILGIYCVFVLFRHRKRKDKFILQRNDSGELAISLKALENMVNKCLDQHQEIHVQNLHMENQKDGLLIRLRGSVAGGISIPLTVEALQRQIKQYVTACSGVEVKGIRLQIDASDKDAEDAPFAIEGPAAKPLLKENNAKQPERIDAPAPAVSAPGPVEPENPAPAEPETETSVPVEDDDDRPLHQRLFKPKTEPCIVPAPPEELPQTEPQEETVSETDGDPESVKEETGEEAESVPAEAEDTAEENGETAGEEIPEEPDFAEPEEAPEAGTEPEGTGAGEDETSDDTEEKRAAREAFAESQKAFDQLIGGQ